MIEIDINCKIETDTSRKHETMQQISNLMNKLGVTHYCTRYVLPRIKHLINNGDEIGTNPDRKGPKGTLGAFVRLEENTNENSPAENTIGSGKPNIVALFSKHLAVTCEKQTLFFETDEIADILDPSKVEGADIAAAEIRKQYTDSCLQSFKTQSGREVPCFLSANPSSLIKGFNRAVHIFGAKSKPGIGWIVSCKYGIGEDSGGASLGQIIEITDRSGRKFAQAGDSGSILCITGKNNDMVYAIGMLMGEKVERNETEKNISGHTQTSNISYIAMELNYGLARLERAHKLKIKWISQNQATNNATARE